MPCDFASVKLFFDIEGTTNIKNTYELFNDNFDCSFSH